MRLSPETMLLLARDGDDQALQALLQWEFDGKRKSLWWVMGTETYMVIKYTM